MMRKKVLIGAGIVAGIAIAATAVASFVESKKLHDCEDNADEDEFDDYDDFEDEEDLDEDGVEDSTESGTQDALS